METPEVISGHNASPDRHLARINERDAGGSMTLQSRHEAAASTELEAQLNWSFFAEPHRKARTLLTIPATEHDLRADRMRSRRSRNDSRQHITQHEGDKASRRGDEETISGLEAKRWLLVPYEPL